MSKVKRVEARGVLRELKLFAFEGNHDFQQGLVTGVRMQKEFVFPTAPIIRDDGGHDLPYQKTIVGFSAVRMGKVRNHNNYDYSIFATSERSITTIPEHILTRVMPIDEDSDEFNELDALNLEDGELSESTTVTFDASDDNVGEILVSQSYEMSVDDHKIFEHSDNDIFYDTPGQFIEMPELESDYDSTKKFVVEPIPHERLPIDEKIASEIAFRAILDPFFYQEYRAVIGFRDATERVRVIMDVMRNGMNVRRLYDEVK